MSITLIPGETSLQQLQQIWHSSAAAELHSSSLKPVEAAAALVAQAASGKAAIYGVNTGFGKLAHIKIEAADTADRKSVV